MRIYTLVFTLVHLLCFSQAQSIKPVSWSFSSEKISEETYRLDMTAEVDDGWYIYSQYLESDYGPVATSFKFAEGDYDLIGKTEEKGKRHEGFDKIFQMKLVKYSGTVRFSQKVKLGETTEVVSGSLMFMTCDDSKCLPPTQVDFTVEIE